MSVPVFTIDGKNFSDFESFIDECNSSFIESFGGKWTGNLNALNDYLCWHDGPYVLQWKNSWKSRIDLGYSEVVRRNLEGILASDNLLNHAMWKFVDEARAQTGPTMFQTIVEIFEDNVEFVQLRLDDRN